MSQRALLFPIAVMLVLGVQATSPALAQVSETSVTLTWTAPGDDSLSGRATSYDLRWSGSPISSLADFARAAPVSGLPGPQIAGSVESATVAGLKPQTTYWFALLTVDEAGNWSGLSNVVSATTLAATDVTRPAPLALALDGTTSSSVTLSWSDVGDDSLTGVATAVEIRHATAPITEATWAAATPVTGVPQPGAPGTVHRLTVAGLDRSRDLWFAARARDDVSLLSAIAPALRVPHVLDTAPPATPAGLSASLEIGRQVRVSWIANAEPDLAGYHVYRALAAGAPSVRLTSTPVTTSEFLDANVPDTVEVWYQVSALDTTGNESARSTALGVALRSVSTDVTRPAPLALALDGTTSSSVTLSWSDVGDDSLTGVATAVEIRHATAPITEATWAAATPVSGVPQPSAPGTVHQLTVTGLDRSLDLWFAARARDEVNHVSAIAPALQVPQQLDTAPPATPAGLIASLESGRKVHLRWTTNAEPDLAGYHVYRTLTASAPFVRLTSTPVTTSEFLDGNVPDTVEVWYKVSALDATGNESARSAALGVVLRDGGSTGASLLVWTLAVPFPNPSRAGTSVTLPVDVPGAGATEATVEIQDAAGRHVRTLEIASATPGPYALAWDGRNDSGRDTVPGVYAAWLHTGGARSLVRFVRTP